MTRYIHLNPLRAGIVADLEKLATYLWTGHAVIMGRLKYEWQETASILSYFGKDCKKGIEKYEEFVRDGIKGGRKAELTGGGLKRSFGGWSEVLSLRRQGLKYRSDDRILGSSQFVEDLLLEAEKKERETLRISSKIINLASLGKEIAQREEVSLLKLRSGSRNRKVVRARKIFCQLAVIHMGYSGAEAARYLGVSTSSVNRSAGSEVMPNGIHLRNRFVFK